MGFMQRRDDVAFVTAGGFADDVNPGLGGQEFEQSALTGGGVGQVVDTTGQMELQVKLGNIQADIDSGHSVLAHSCKYELALVGRSINGSSLGHRHERLWLLTHMANGQCQRVTSSSAPLSCRLQAAGQSHLPSPSVPGKVRWKFRYKREKKWCVCQDVPACGGCFAWELIYSQKERMVHHEIRVARRCGTPAGPAFARTRRGSRSGAGVAARWCCGGCGSGACSATAARRAHRP